MSRLVVISTLVVLGLTNCGPHQGANVDHFIDCVGDGCDSSYQDKVRKYRGPAGETGQSGQTGSSGSSGPSGTNGADGEDGVDGVDGADGEDCQSVEVNGGALIQCSDSSVFIRDGVDAEINLHSIIDPCGPEASYDEVILVYEVDGVLQYLAYFESGSNRYLTLLKQGVNYQTTDGTKCKFKINADNEYEEL